MRISLIEFMNSLSNEFVLQIIEPLLTPCGRRQMI
jgi:hypothetical protein